MRRLLACLVLTAACSPPPVAPPPRAPTTTASPPPEATPLVWGETFTLDSKVLGERRVINVYLPPGYAEGTARYPVLYMPDGGMKEDFPHITGIVDVSAKNEAMRPFMVVGVENTERRRDLLSASSVADEKKIAPHAGGADAFRKFLRDELKPRIAARYRTTAESALIGESFAGLFVIETLLVDPELFDSYLAVDPSVWWNDGALVRSAPSRLATWTAKPKALFVATADYKPTQEGVLALESAIREKKPNGLTIHLQPLPEEHHNTIFPVAALKGLRRLFPAAAH
jgi:predicted alpha/beta superfamily hydrolase